MLLQMLCSRCSTPIRPVVALDIDGTLGDYHGHFFEFMLGYAGQIVDEHDTYRGDIPYGQYICETFDVSIDEFRNAKLAYRQGALKRTMPVYEGADQLAKRISERAELWITTTRPYLRMDNIDPDTREWLARNEIPCDGLLYHKDKYEILREHVDPRRVVAILDDLAENLEPIPRLFGRTRGIGIQFATIYNERCRMDTVATSHHEAEKMILDRIERWKRDNG